MVIGCSAKFTTLVYVLLVDWRSGISFSLACWVCMGISYLLLLADSGYIKILVADVVLVYWFALCISVPR